ncbi:MAG TPA: tRNA (adenosine(37)-N6)-threonylcarbamoyltransferase complex transferase subunit TsaD [Spirochaetia bacterium]|nr:MAG: tRNA (adenosine(37)-N6)-threonylcarbamoyltransferase complex transferase subunit TsaD [Spirochaetes bacterium GWE1_32_154]OHD52169.1 MAG: tRNA (adenosine(37)-N6)-threonylcarbamoyltransferase complex transferase subunit TsaD [Spirochaetes bacterium GWE2_31_10]HBI39311.1 tRNA (adenosine(37)-N6)-threonylcarbamoyltransferase complex transferase subunit TsaD [Spirochaetia bacterium]
MVVLGIESTCDETSVAIVRNGNEVLSNVVTSQIKDHLPWNGVVPEIASRLHLKKIIHLTEEACKEAHCSINDIDLIAAANRPGLIGGLIVGSATGKAFAWAIDKPFIGINHMEAHLYSPHITNEIPFPYIGLLVSGGHTMIVLAQSHTTFSVIGTTIDDAVGEAFDKLAKHYAMGYPGGPSVEKLALTGDESTFDFPTSNLHKSDRKYDVSYSGIKTAAINFLEKYLKKETYTLNDIAASFQKRAFSVLKKKCISACIDYNINRIVVAGGVSANFYLRHLFSDIPDITTYFPDIKYATDNGAMIAGYAYHTFKENGPTPLTSGVSARVSGFKISLEKK